MLNDPEQARRLRMFLLMSIGIIFVMVSVKAMNSNEDAKEAEIIELLL